MNAYEMELLLDQDREEEDREKFFEDMDQEYEEEEDELWDDLFDGYFYEDPMERAMWEVGMSWHDFI